MNILHVVPSLDKEHGGPTTAVLGLSKALARLGHHVEIFTTKNEADKIANHVQDGFGVVIHYFDRRMPHRYGYSSSLEKALSERILDFDVVHIHTLWLYPTWIAGFWSRKRHVPYLIRPCGMLDRYCLGQKPLRKTLYAWFRERRNLNGAQAIHFTSDFEMQESRGVKLKSPSIIVPLGIHTENFEISPPAGTFSKLYPETKDKRIILFLGRLHPIKGLDLLIEAFSEIINRYSDIHLVLAGPNERGYQKTLERRIMQKKLLNHVTFTGFLDHAAKLAAYHDALIFCLPSHHENFSVTAVEAMATGLPTIVTDQVSISYEAAKEKAALVTSCSTSIICEALKQLLEDSQLRAQISRNAKRLVKDKFNWEKVAQSMVAVYQRLTKKADGEFPTALEPQSVGSSG